MAPVANVRIAAMLARRQRAQAFGSRGAVRSANLIRRGVRRVGQKYSAAGVGQRLFAAKQSESLCVCASISSLPECAAWSEDVCRQPKSYRYRPQIVQRRGFL
jgi:hypothetical protein